MQAYQENISAKVSGTLAPILGVKVTVTDKATGNPAALYSDNGVTPLDQARLVTDEVGYFGFYAANGDYVLTFSSPQIKLGPREVQLYDPNDNEPLTQAQAALPSGAERIGFIGASGAAASVAQLASNVGASLIGTSGGVPLEQALGGKLSVVDVGAGGVPVFAAGTPTPGVSARHSANQQITTHAQYGFLDNSNINYGTPGFYGHASFNSNVTLASTADADHHHDYQAYPHKTGTGTIGNLSAYWSQPDIQAGTVSELTQFRASNPLGTGTITNLYGLLVDELTRGTNNYAVYTSGATPSFFGGALRLGQIGNPADIRYDPNSGNLQLTPRSGYHTALPTGSLLVGVTVPAASEKVNVTGSTTDYIARLYASHATSPKGVAIVFSGAAPNGTGNEFLYCQDSAAVRMKVLSNGNLQNVNNSYGALSDLKLKERITDASPKLDKLMLVRIVNYFLIEQPDQQLLGVIAQELEKIWPGMIEETIDYADVEVAPERVETQQRQKVELREHVDHVPTLVDGQWRTMPVASRVEVPLYEEFPLFDSTGSPVIEILRPEQAEVLDDDGNVKTPFLAEISRQRMHSVPITEEVQVTIPAQYERRPTGTTTKAVKYSIFVPILIKAMQEQQGQIDGLQQLIADHIARTNT